MKVKEYRKLKAGVFIRAAEMMEQGNPNGACSAIKEALLEVNEPEYYGGYTNRHHKLLDEVFRPDGNTNAYYFGPPMKWYREKGKKAALKHRIYSLLMLAAMVEHAKR